MAIVWLALIIIGPIVGIYLLKSNAAMVFLALCLGYVLLSFDSHNANNLTSSHIPVHLKTSSIIVNLVLLIGPALLTLVAQSGSIHANRKLLNLLPAIGVGLFGALLVVPRLPASLMQSIVTTHYWAKLIAYQSDIVGIGSGVAILFLWLSLKKDGAKKHHGKSKA